ncbi:MAG TPA: type II toxin-antitoxin system VapB family antitoxin [Spirochaetota bacterium]|nr:type II toxin-antitoxin system VapB family antitoxin [Spirochaetota bacterium]HPJ44313.1 type II toxin-antitoxin system VapB family antitoxin [Spirochaetota bacterium]HRX48468.1 type II toxin-antitoxin system VapB family antitoxin [Spirochaetota bacterium]
MATNLNIDIKLLDEVYQIGKFKTKREAVNTALREYIQKHRQKDMLKYLNTVDFDSDYDYKKNRKR